MGEAHESKQWDVFCENNELRLDNDMLRELVSELVACVGATSDGDMFYYQPTEDGCGIDCVVNGEDCSFSKMRDRAGELGVDA